MLTNFSATVPHGGVYRGSLLDNEARPCGCSDFPVCVSMPKRQRQPDMHDPQTLILVASHHRIRVCNLPAWAAMRYQ